MKKYCFNLIIILLFYTSLLSQQSVMHFDKPLHFAGEPVFYSLHAHKGIFPDNTIAKVEFYAKNGLIEYHFHQFENNNIHGLVKSSYLLNSDVYLFRVKVYDDLSQEEIVISETFHPIYNDNEIKALKVIEQKQSNLSIHKSSNLSNVITSEEKNFHHGQTIEFKLDDLDDIKNQMVSVTIRERINTELTPVSSPLNETGLPHSGTYMDKVPLKGSRMLLTSTRFDNPLLFAILPEDLKFTGALVKEEKFNMKLPIFYGVKKIQFFDLLSIPLKIIPEEITSLDTSAFPSLIVNDQIIQKIEEFRTRKLIYSLYNEVETSVQPINSSINKETIPPDYEIDISDYALKGNLADFCKEVFTSLKFSKNKSNMYEARVMFEQGGLNKYYEHKSLFVINGVTTTDDHYAGSLPIHTIGSIRIFSDYDKLQSTFGRGALSGLIEIEMIDPSFVLPAEYTLPKLEMQGLQEDRKYPINIENQSKAPAFKSMVYWNPAVMVSDSGTLEIQFTAPQDNGSFIVEIATMNKDKNKINRQYPVNFMPDAGQ